MSQPLAYVRLPFPITTGAIAKAFDRTPQQIRRRANLRRLSEIGEIIYDPASVEEFAAQRGLGVIWVDPLTDRSINPATGQLAASA